MHIKDILPQDSKREHFGQGESMQTIEYPHEGGKNEYDLICNPSISFR
jgi:hypothetical protein